VQREVAARALAYERGLQDGTIPKVGVNRHRMDEETRQVELHPYRPEQAQSSIRRTAEVVAGRDAQAAAAALERLRDVAREGTNVMPAMMDAVRSYATLGEITQVLKSVFGEFREPSLF
jgi:methylmalonyl-CoA mutase N-terminal domain/subunit